MTPSREDVARIAAYARIALTEAETDEMHAYLLSALELLEPIRVCELDGIEPTYHPCPDLANVMRGDAPEPARSLSTEAALSGTAAHDGQAFRVPSILGDAQGGA